MIFRGQSDHEVEAGGQFSRLRALQGIEGDRNEFLDFRVAAPQPPVEAISGIGLFTLDVELGSEEPLFLPGHRDVDVRGAARVGGRFYGAEVILSL